MLTVVCQFNIIWQTTVSCFMQANVVAHVGEQCMAGTNAVGKGYGIVNKLVRVMRTVEAKGVDHKGVNTPQQFCLVRLDGFHVGDIGKAAKAETQDRQLAVHDTHRKNVDVANSHRLSSLNLMQTNGRHTWIAVGGKAIGQHLKHASASLSIGIDVDFAKLAVGSYVVHPTHMVVVSMSNKDAIDATEGLGKYLLAEVRPAVYEESRVPLLDEDGATKTFVFSVTTLANLTRAAYHWHPARCSRT